jgi:translation initiation factor 1
MRGVAERIVYSTTSGRMCPRCGWPQKDCRCAATLAEGREPVGTITAKLRVEKRASGKSVTIVDGLPDNSDFLAAVAKELKRACGTGGSVGDRSVELQGDQRERLHDLLSKKGWGVKG